MMTRDVTLMRNLASLLALTTMPFGNEEFYFNLRMNVGEQCERIQQKRKNHQNGSNCWVVFHRKANGREVKTLEVTEAIGMEIYVVNLDKRANISIIIDPFAVFCLPDGRRTCHGH
jgi:hypothetical protein